MKCIKCGKRNDKIVDSRKRHDGVVVRRQRECQECGCRWETFELSLKDICTKDIEEIKDLCD